MNDKLVYPVLVDEGLRHGQPSAPPLAVSNAVAVHMPYQKAIHKEQEEGLLQHDQKNDQKLLGRPPARSAAAAMAMAPPVAGAGKGSCRRRRGCCCCCLASFLGTLAVIVVILGVAALIIYLALKPKVPKFSVTDAAINEFKLGSSPAAGPGKDKSDFKVDTDIAFSVEARNPNKKISFYYDDVGVILFYEDQNIGQGSIPAFHQPHKNTTFLSLPIHARQASLTSSSAVVLQSSLQSDASIPLQARAVTKARVKVGRWKSRRRKIHVICTFQLSNPNTTSSADVSVVSKSCKLKLKIAHITLTFK
ncbi:hypothetical protein L7F22_046121 [Adiantum nelumboides]|nr:hypothetical protein [Adiantum nelumboides]